MSYEPYIKITFTNDELEKYRESFAKALMVPKQILFQENVNVVLDNISNYDKGEKGMKVRLPYSVNFVEKHKRTTLVWKDVFTTYCGGGGYFRSEESFSTTKSEAHNEKFNYLYGFLMAYFKRVHKEKSKTQLKKYLNAVIYPMSKMSQLAFLQGVFYENCGLTYKEAKEYLQKIEKGVEFENGKEK